MGTATEQTLRRILAELESDTLPTDAATETTLALILAECEDIPKHANFDIHPTTKDLGVAIDSLPNTPVVYNVTMTTANTEYSQALPANAQKFLIKCRAAYDIKVCFTAEASGTTYITVPAGMSYYEDLIQPSALTLYFQCATAAQVAEIVAWS